MTKSSPHRTADNGPIEASSADEQSIGPRSSRAPSFFGYVTDRFQQRLRPHSYSPSIIDPSKYTCICPGEYTRRHKSVQRVLAPHLFDKLSGISGRKYADFIPMPGYENVKAALLDCQSLETIYGLEKAKAIESRLKSEDFHLWEYEMDAAFCRTYSDMQRKNEQTARSQNVLLPTVHSWDTV